MLLVTVGDLVAKDFNGQQRNAAKPSTFASSTTIVDGNVTTIALESIRELYNDGEWQCGVAKQFAFASSTTMACRREKFFFSFLLDDVLGYGNFKILEGLLRLL
jgi:hypothetical protein